MSGTLEHAEKRVYEDFAKVLAQIFRMPPSPRKNKALATFHVLKELCFGDSL